MSRILTEDGVKYDFDMRKFHTLYSKKVHDYGMTEAGLNKEIAKALNLSDTERVRNWARGKSGPSDIELVHDLERFFGLDKNKLLKELTSKTEEGIEMAKIQDYERNAARELYTKMCDLINDLEFRSDVLFTGVEGKGQGLPLLEKEPQPWLYCDKLIQEIRKIGFDLPLEMREDLMAFVYETFEGDRDGEMYFAGNWYAAFRQEQGLEDTERSRKIFSIYYIEDRYEALNAIFDDYLRTQKEG